ncbi:FAS1 domain-containing protein SELMODRAFT_448915 [Malania oleifera]|uniref:FAS1 domain-containing protein SELMODRAFT_448915 n=1 Tax=Malania oleifera TaxID=397392 RepID=UPI0025AE714A|nr:FAS1 domain-containing protein SELMODRAFT_448915 [Malania oleifera]
MATHMVNHLVLLLALILPAAPTKSIPSRSQDLLVAIEEMQRANYFTFVTLINMSPADLFRARNITFLMPNDRLLSNGILSGTAISDFLLLHSIPSPLLFDYLEHIPSGSIIPTSKPEFVLKIKNHGRRSFFLNNARIISPNICIAGSSIRCHGIDGLLSADKLTSEHNSTVPTPKCPSSSPPPIVAATPPALVGHSPPSLPPPPPIALSLTPLVAPPPARTNVHSEKSASSPWPSYRGLLPLVMLFVLGLSV